MRCYRDPQGSPSTAWALGCGTRGASEEINCELGLARGGGGEVLLHDLPCEGTADAKAGQHERAKHLETGSSGAGALMWGGVRASGTRWD